MIAEQFSLWSYRSYTDLLHIIVYMQSLYKQLQKTWWPFQSSMEYVFLGLMHSCGYTETIRLELISIKAERVAHKYSNKILMNLIKMIFLKLRDLYLYELIIITGEIIVNSSNNLQDVKIRKLA